MAFTTLVVGLNVLGAFVPILIGLAIDFGVHLVTRYEENCVGSQRRRSQGAGFHGSGHLCRGATAGAFLAMGLTDFRGIREMGIICGGGLVIV
jgi:predicted RND superfamily exporter protein